MERILTLMVFSFSFHAIASDYVVKTRDPEDCLNFRESSYGDILGCLPSGTRVKYLGDGRRRYVKVEVDGQVGYVWNRYLRDAPKESSRDPATPPAETPTQADPTTEQRPPSPPAVNPRAGQGMVRDELAGSDAQTPPPSGEQTMLSLGREEKDLKYGGTGVKWDGCDPNAAIQGGNEPGQCGNDILNPSFAEHLNRNLLSCAQDAALKAGYPKPVKLYIKHDGCYVPRTIAGSSRLSNHAFGRAMDINGITLIDDAGGKTKFSSHVRDYKGANKKFYNAFRQCWKDNLPGTCRGKKGSIGIPHSPLGGNHQHNDHIHLEFPPKCG